MPLAESVAAMMSASAELQGLTASRRHHEHDYYNSIIQSNVINDNETHQKQNNQPTMISSNIGRHPLPALHRCTTCMRHKYNILRALLLLPHGLWIKGTKFWNDLRSIVRITVGHLLGIFHHGGRIRTSKIHCYILE